MNEQEIALAALLEQQKSQSESLELIASELEKLRVLREYELGLVLSESESGDIRVDELER